MRRLVFLERALRCAELLQAASAQWAALFDEGQFAPLLFDAALLPFYAGQQFRNSTKEMCLRRASVAIAARLTLLLRRLGVSQLHRGHYQRRQGLALQAFGTIKKGTGGSSRLRIGNLHRRGGALTWRLCLHATSTEREDGE